MVIIIIIINEDLYSSASRPFNGARAPRLTRYNEQQKETIHTNHVKNKLFKYKQSTRTKPITVSTKKLYMLKTIKQVKE